MNAQKTHIPNPNNLPQSVVLKIEKQGPNTLSLRTVVNMVLPDGTKRHEESIRTFDNNERPVPEHAGVTEMCESLDASTVRCTQKRDGELVVEVLGRLSEDGKTSYLQETRFDNDGKPKSGFVGYEKQ